MRTKSLYSLLGLILAVTAACRKQLDTKPSSRLEEPTTATDFQAIMDYANIYSSSWPYAGTAGADEGFVTDATWQAAALTARNAYIWDRNVFNDQARNDWSIPYTAVFYTNVVLDGIRKYGEPGAPWDNIRGQASFFRGYAYYQLAQEFCKPYQEQTAATDAGLVLRASADPNEKSTRSAMQQTYRQIISDLSLAVRLLPQSALTKTRPCKAAAYAVLARTYLCMRQYGLAGLYADSSLQLNSTLMDYNKINAGTGAPFKRFNEEVLVHTTIFPSPMILPVRYLVDTTLFALYEPGDLRKKLFFKALKGSTYMNFNGSYDGTSTLFGGPATDEMFLVRAECNARAGKLTAALADLNFLRKNRYQAASYQSLNSGDPSVVLQWTLQERRKELLLRGLRWMDLRRLNQEPAYAQTLMRVIGGQRYILQPGDNWYVWPIPQAVIGDTGIAQN